MELKVTLDDGVELNLQARRGHQGWWVGGIAFAPDSADVAATMAEVLFITCCRNDALWSAAHRLAESADAATLDIWADLEAMGISCECELGEDD